MRSEVQIVHVHVCIDTFQSTVEMRMQKKKSLGANVHAHVHVFTLHVVTMYL